ncbi:hypothetical protein D8674_030790 [Pyrus ussuriensis x Pyrus communis]|uniref:Uncharacterized protein n=1 Tax=Pyrus ussuriensis x Pyrus communis TaxID=2448454 RepID=A0A5N5F2C1_9ROSA|nr:hypothetical protein D8674_030790 [Pyrus ussuriensis x Pyrus communis]
MEAMQRQQQGSTNHSIEAKLNSVEKAATSATREAGAQRMLWQKALDACGMWIMTTPRIRKAL